MIIEKTKRDAIRKVEMMKSYEPDGKHHISEEKVFWQSSLK